MTAKAQGALDRLADAAPRQGIEPMTAAEYREGLTEKCDCPLCQRERSILAALEEREALLGASNGVSAETVDQMLAEATRRNADAAVGSLVRRIREHKAFKGAVIWMPDECAWQLPHLSDSQLEGCLSHLDSLLPKEPEVVVGPSGIRFRRRADGVIEREWGAVWQTCFTVEMCDAPVVAALLGGRNGE